MIFNILDRQFNTLTSMDNSIRGAIHFFDDEFHRYLQQGLSTFDFSVLRNNEDVKYFVEGNYIQFEYKSRDYLLTIRRIEEDETKLTIFTEDLNFDLLNEYVPAYTAPKARPIADYLNDIIANSHVVIGINEVRSYSRTLSWDGEATVLERLMSIVKQFDAEHEFVTVLNDDRSLDKIVLNIYHKRDDKYQGVGVDRTDTELRFGENVKTVRRTTDITELFTCIRPIGTDGLTIKDKAETIKDENGNVLYFTNKGSEYIFAPKANQLFGRPELGNKGYIAMPYSFDTKSVNTLYGNALAELKKFSEPAVTYEVEGYYDLNIGDVVSIADNKYNPVLLLEARVAEMVISFTSPEQNKTVFSNYRVFESQISNDLLDRMGKLKEDVDYAIQVAKTPIFKISTVGSTVFKNGEGSVKLIVAVERANADVTEEYSVFNWIKQNKDGSVDAEWSAAHEDFGTTLTISPDDFADTATFSYVAVKDGETFTGGGATVVKIFDGEDGKTPVKGVDYFDGVDGADGKTAYIHIRYSQSADGTGMTENPAGAVYIGLQTSQNPVASTIPADYMWSKIKGADGIPGENGADGKTSYLHIKYSDDGGMTFTANNGETAGAYMGQYVDFTQADSTDVTKYTWSKVKGEQGPKGDTGDKGVPGTPGADGRTPYFHTAYAWSADGTDRFTPVYPSENLIVNSGNFKTLAPWSGGELDTTTFPFPTIKGTESLTQPENLILKSDTEYVAIMRAYFTTEVEISWNFPFHMYVREEGNGVQSGRENVELLGGYRKAIPNTWENIVIKFKTIATNKKITFKPHLYHNNWNGAERWLQSVMLVEGNKIPDFWIPNPAEDYANAYPTYIGTYTDYTEADSTNPADYTWVRILGEAGQDGKDGIAGKDGIGIKSTAVTYALADSGTTAPTSGWTATVPTLIKGRYLWTKTVWTYTDNSTETGYSVTYVAKDGNNGTDGIAGKDGVGIKSTAITYAASTSGTTAPTTGWTTAVPTVAAGSFLWTKTVWTYTDSTTETGYSVAKMGENGSDGKDGADGSDGKDGVGIASTAITYQASSDGTTAPTGPWLTTIPTVAANQYLWTRTVITYTNNTNSTAYSVGKMGANGTNGTNGKDGADGKGIQSTAITYQAATSGTTVPTGTWAATIPSVAENQYLWTRTVITYTDSTTSTSYAIGKMGAQGPKGDTGQNGSDGKGIKSTAITYQASTSGTTVPTGTWVASPPSVAANQYLWTRTVMTFTDNTTTTGYSIGKMGANGTNGKDGTDGVSVSSVVEEYYVSTSPTGQAGGSWSTTVPNNADPNLYVWRRMKTTLSNGNVSYTNPALIQGMTGIYPYIGPSQPANPKEGQQWWKSDASGNITDFLVYKSGSWQGQTIQQSILNIVKLNAVEITGSVITGTTINGSKFNTTFDFNPFPNGTVKRKGTLQIADAKTVIDYTTYDSNGNVNQETGTTTYGEEGVTLNRIPTGDQAHAQFLQLSPYGLTMNVGTVGGTLRYQDVVTYPKTGIPASSGFTQYSSSTSSANCPTAQRIGRVVQLAGAFKNNEDIPADSGTKIMGTLPVWARPATSVNALVQGTGHNIYLMGVNTNGNISFDRYRGDTGSSNNYKFDFKTCGAGSWLNIAVTYAAADMPE